MNILDVNMLMAKTLNKLRAPLTSISISCDDGGNDKDNLTFSVLLTTKLHINACKHYLEEDLKSRVVQYAKNWKGFQCSTPQLKPIYETIYTDELDDDGNPKHSKGKFLNTVIIFKVTI